MFHSMVWEHGAGAAFREAKGGHSGLIRPSRASHCQAGNKPAPKRCDAAQEALPRVCPGPPSDLEWSAPSASAPILVGRCIDLSSFTRPGKFFPFCS
jgi:hypothetical protein